LNIVQVVDPQPHTIVGFNGELVQPFVKVERASPSNGEFIILYPRNWGAGTPVAGKRRRLALSH
jgi:hypothetical protein